jgi:hypothetical protein
MSEIEKESFTAQDKVLHQGLVHLLNQGKFELSAKDVQAFANIIQWVNTIPQKFEMLEAPLEKEKEDKKTTAK